MCVCDDDDDGGGSLVIFLTQTLTNSLSSCSYIAKAIGPQDVLATLLNNLKVQERQNRVCTS